MRWIALLLSLRSTVLAAQAPFGFTFTSGALSSGEASEFTTYQSSTSPHSIRIKRQNDTICDARSAQYTGWLDVGRKHFFFWYFESQQNPHTDPLALWLTGGPGVSGMLGMLGELGPCLINQHGNGTVHNPSGWSAVTNLIFVDQPAGVGYSYLKEGDHIPGDSFSAAEDMHAFLQIFISQVFPEKANVPFHITGESYAGHYVPALGAEIIRQNALHPHQTQVPLQSVFIGNAYVSPLDTTYGFWETLCTTNPGVDHPVLNETVCDAMAANMPRCLDVSKVCYEHPDPAICLAADHVCGNGVTRYFDGSRNPYDITKDCVGSSGLCYTFAGLVQDYLNTPVIWSALGVPSAVKHYKEVSEHVFRRFLQTGDEFISMEPQVQYLLANEIDVLFYQGNLDLACNTAGNLRWANSMSWKGQTEFTSKALKPWTSKAVDGKAKQVGTYKMVEKQMHKNSEKKTVLAFVIIDKSGHLVPYDQPEIALDMATRWLDHRFRG